MKSCPVISNFALPVASTSPLSGKYSVLSAISIRFDGSTASFWAVFLFLAFCFFAREKNFLSAGSTFLTLPSSSVETSAAQPAVSSVETEGYSVSSPQTDSAGGLKAALGEYMEFVRFVDSGNTAAQHEFAHQHGEMEDLIFDKINEIAVDYFGDVILYESANGPAIVDEYRKELFYD